MATARCKLCGNEVSFNNPIAASLARAKGIICESCRRNGRQWDRATYDDYLKSKHWQAFRQRALKHYGRKCYLCGEADCQIDLHHNDYSRIGGELISDVIPLCRDCHEDVPR